LLTQDPKQLAQSAARYIADSDILYVAFTTAKGELVFEHGQSAGHVMGAHPSNVLEETESYYAGWAPISVEGLEVGRVQLVVSKHRLHAGTKLYRRLILGGLLGSVVALALALLFVERYIVPILKLTQRAFRELEVTTAAALASTRAKSRFLANMSHEIRTPMNGVLGMVHLLQQTKLDRGQQHYVDVIAGSANSLLKIVNDILDFSKLEAQKYELTPVPCDVRAVLDQTVSLFHAKVREKAIQLSVEVDDSVPSTLLIDGDRFRQVVSNLLSNALKFTRKGEVWVRVLAVRDPVSSEHDPRFTLRVEVADTGMGVPVHARQRLFRAFSQVDESSARTHEGTGLGLAISRRLVELMDGKIKYAEREGGGSVFSFEFPTTTCSDAPPERAKMPLDLHFQCELPVLVVDDNEINQLVAMEMVENLGLEVEIVGGGREAVSTVASGDYALVLMDCQMPDVDGYQATREIRELADGGRRVPIVACTAHALEEEREKVLACGMDDYIVKPIEPEVLHRTLAKWLPTGRTSATHRSPEVESGEPAGAHNDNASSFGAEAKSASTARRETARAKLLEEPVELPVLRDVPSRSSRVTDLFLRTLPEQLDDLAKAAAEGRMALVRDQAHKMKGSVGSIGAVRMAEVCERLQLCAESIDSARATACVKLLERMYELVQEGLTEKKAAKQVSS
jgi:signal transduction histidine kinase/DNA-binding response OmpR family regulator